MSVGRRLLLGLGYIQTTQDSTIKKDKQELCVNAPLLSDKRGITEQYVSCDTSHVKKKALTRICL